MGNEVGERTKAVHALDGFRSRAALLSGQTFICREASIPRLGIAKTKGCQSKIFQTHTC